MKKVYDLAVKTGSYISAAGETKNRYENVGSIMEHDNGQFIILNRTFNPAGVPNPDNKSSVIVSMFKPKTDGAKNATTGTPADNVPPFDEHNAFNDDSIPF